MKLEILVYLYLNKGVLLGVSAHIFGFRVKPVADVLPCTLHDG